jgi:hypothetical protein
MERVGSPGRVNDSIGHGLSVMSQRRCTVMPTVRASAYPEAFNRFCYLSGVVISVAVGVLAARPVDGADVGGEGVRLPPPAFAYKGTTLCTRCHRSPQGEWCDEATTAAWRHDAHARSHLALSSDNDRTRAMEQALGITAAKTAACVACHTRPAAEPPVEEENEFVHAGISCETCHGPGSGYFEPHMEKSWRFLTSAEKEALGMRDLRDPVAKAANCLSCHLGEVATGRVISHEMYAAGHPPLPAFEMEAFSAGMGRHWKRVWEKGTRVQAAATQAGYATEGASDLARTLVGSLATLRASATLIEAYAAASLADGDARPWPELALYDCQACHHDLVVPSWRQEAGYGGLVPGRPSLVRWPRVLAGVALEEAGGGGDVDALLESYVALLNRRPFGDPAGLRDLPDAPLAALDAAIAAIARWPRDASLEGREADAARRLAAAGARVGDFESARLLAWALAARRGGAAADGSGSGDLATLLALGFPPPDADPAATTPFWITSLQAAAAADIPAIRAAFTASAAVRAGEPHGRVEPIRSPPRTP